MVYFHSIDFVLRREKILHQAWSARCHLPKTLFVPSKGRSRRASSKCFDYIFFKRMIATKTVVYKWHRRMFHLYEKFCEEASFTTYWNDDESDEDDDNPETAAATNEVVKDDAF